MTKIAVRVLSAAAMGSIALPVVAAAQTAPAPSTAAANPTTASGDIVVTAERRSERLRDVPISVTVLNQDTLIRSGINTTTDIQRVAPGVQLPFYGGFLQPAIRGISSAGAGLGDSSNVAIYVDGVYQASETGQLVDLPDVQQIEILKGPQGTLYGQNAAGGAIIINTITPSFTPSGRFSASYGNYNDLSLRGYATAPIVDDKVALSIAGAYRERDGYRTDILRGGHDSGLESTLFRARLLVKPTENLSFILGGYYSDRKDGGVYAGQPLAGAPGTALGYGLADAYGVPIPKPTNPQQFAANVQPLVAIETYGINLLGKLEASFGTFSTVSAFTRVKTRDDADVDYTAANLGAVQTNLLNKNFIQEVNFSSRKIGKFSFTAGAFFMALKESYVPNIFIGYATDPDSFSVYPAAGTQSFQITERAYNRKRSYAAYAEASYEIASKLTVTAGGRYAYETQQTADNHSSLLGFTDGPLIPDPRGKVSFSKFTPKATIRYALNDTSNVYASYSQGFKSGYVNANDSPFVTPLVKPVSPEKVYAYEVGYKGKPIDWLNFNFAAFLYDYKDLQVYTYNPPTELYQNAASARIKGLEGDITVKMSPELTLTAGGAYLDAKYLKFPNAEGFVPSGTFGYSAVSVNASGNRLTRAPKFSGNAALNYQTRTTAGTFGASVSTTYNSGIYYDAANTVQQHAYALLDGELSFSPSSLDRLRLVLWGKNLTNKAYLSSVLTLGYVLAGSYADPRTYGVRAEFAF